MAIKNNITVKPLCHSCESNSAVRCHDTRNGVKRYRCMRCRCIVKYLTPLNEEMKKHKQKRAEIKRAEQVCKEFEIILVWLSDYQSISSTARNLDTSRYFVKEAIMKHFRNYMCKDIDCNDETPTMSFTELRHKLRRSFYNKDKGAGFNDMVQTAQQTTLPSRYIRSTNEIINDIERKYGVCTAYSKLLLEEEAVVVEQLPRDINQLIFEYGIICDWLDIGGDNLYKLAKKHGISRHGIQYKSIEKLLKERFKVELGSREGNIRQLRKYMRKKCKDFERDNMYNYGIEKARELLKLVLFDSKSDFYNNNFRTEDEIINEYELNSTIIDNLGYPRLYNKPKSKRRKKRTPTATPQTA